MYPGINPGTHDPGPHGQARRRSQEPNPYGQQAYNQASTSTGNVYSQMYSAPYAPQHAQQAQQGYAGGPQPFLPGVPMHYAQQYGGGYAAAPSAPPLPGHGAASVEPGISMPAVSPMAFMAGSSLLSGGQHWGQSLVNKVQQRTGWLTGGLLNFYFNVSRAYVLSKLLMLVAPFLRRWTYSRQPEQIHGGQKYRPPIVDVNSPDLYIPLVGLWAYTMLVCVVHAAHGTFKPDRMYATLWTACSAWTVHLVLCRVVLRALALPTSVAWVDLLAYTGYAFVPACLTILGGLAAGPWGYWCAFGYVSLCMAIFMVRTMKRILTQESGHYGRDITLTNYLLLSLAMFQFPYIFWLGLRL